MPKNKKSKAKSTARVIGEGAADVIRGRHVVRSRARNIKDGRKPRDNPGLTPSSRKATGKTQIHGTTADGRKFGTTPSGMAATGAKRPIKRRSRTTGTQVEKLAKEARAKRRATEDKKHPRLRTQRARRKG